MFKQTTDDIELEKLIKQQKNLESIYEQSFQTFELTTIEILKAIKHSDYNKFQSNRLIWNVAGYVNITSYDLKILGKELTFANGEWRKRYFARQTCALIYEQTQDLPELLGKNFRTEVSKLSIAHELITELNGISKKINEYKNKNHNRLKEVRNIATAHRDQDVLEQYNLIESVRWHEVLGYLFEFDNILNELGKTMQKIINKSVSELDR